MKTYGIWQQAYQDALLEVRPDRLRPLLEAAECAIVTRRRELLQGTWAEFRDEINAIESALHNLHILAELELKGAPTRAAGPHGSNLV